ncbi:MAG: class I SAM-dependent rRNA methyltransferase, partial [Acidobacteriota bacterium]
MPAPNLTASAVLSPRGTERLRLGHPWIYRSDIARAKAEPGDLVLVKSERGRPLGWALWSSESQIALRFVSTDGNVNDQTLWRDRLVTAIAYRDSLALDGTACRLVHGEADRLPALIVDRYDDVLVMQTLCQGMDRRRDQIAQELVNMLMPRGILARNDPKVRRLEGLEERVDVLYGEVPDTIRIREGAIHYDVDVRHGQKTGLFLDQRENHEAAARYATGRGLDAFTYHGGFALQMAAKCTQVVALDGSEAAIAAVQANCASNGITNVEARVANVFDELREFEVSGEHFDTIVLDPPAFAKSKSSIPGAVAGYKEINLRAFKLLNPGGHLITCSCSYNVDDDLFFEIIAAAASDARATIALVERRLQSRDHPVLVGVPETSYLKCLV